MKFPKINTARIREWINEKTEGFRNRESVANSVITAVAVVRMVVIAAGIWRTLRMASTAHKLVNIFFTATKKIS